MDKQQLINLLKEGKTHREIAEIIGCSKSSVGYWINKYGINNMSLNINDITYKDKTFFNKINTKEKAYILGFLLGDGHISSKVISTTIALNDKEVADFMYEVMGGSIIINNTTNKKKKQYPNVIFSLYNNTLKRDLHKQSGGYLKEDRHIPRIPKHLERYLLLGFFDAEGYITWGRRKDRNRIWQKISFTSQLKMLEGVQNILLNEVGVPSIIRPKSNSKCFVLEIANKQGVLDIGNYLYSDEFVVLKRKFHNFQALRLELEELGRD